MRQDSSQADGSVVLTSGPVAAPRGQAETAGLLARIPSLENRLSRPMPRVLTSAAAGRLAITALLLGSFALAAFAAARASPLVPHSSLGFPTWESGPLHLLFGHPRLSWNVDSYGLSGLALLMGAAYGVALAAVRTLSMRTIVVSVVAVHLILLLSPPMQLTDLFNYLGYARLGAVHHLNPYTHGINAELHDPIFRFTSWHNLRSPYGPLFTAITYPVAWLPIPVAYWVLKISAVLLSLGFVGLVWKIARLLGRDPRFAVVFVALNPIYLIYGLGGFHNDFFMLVPSTAAIALLLTRRDRSAGALLMFAVAVKFTAILLLPFLLIAARPAARRLRVLAGAVLAAIPLAMLSVALFGFTIPNLSDQSTLLTDFSVPNLIGDVLGLGGAAPALLRLANVALVLTVIVCLRRKTDWLTGAGWSTLALIASLAWLVPWYIIWLLPLAALGTSVRLRRAALAFTVFLVIAFVPATGIFLRDRGIDLLGGSAGQASMSLQHKLAQ